MLLRGERSRGAFRALPVRCAELAHDSVMTRLLLSERMVLCLVLTWRVRATGSGERAPGILLGSPRGFRQPRRL
eukprot:3917709-Rhodomonas_salina.7